MERILTAIIGFLSFLIGYLVTKYLSEDVKVLAIVSLLSTVVVTVISLTTPTKKKSLLKRCIINLLVFIVALGGGMFVGSMKPGWVKVPNVVGQTLQEARGRLTDDNLLRVSVEPSDAHDNWKVTRQEPKGGTKKPKGTTIKLWASPEKTEVPDLEGKSERESKSILGKRGLKCSITKEYSDKEEGTVIAQKPLPHTRVEPGSTVELTIAIPWPVIPNVVGMQLSEAIRIIRNAGFGVATTTEYSEQPEDTVIRQNPPPGTATPETVVHLTIARWVEVPNVVGITLQEARGRLTDDNLLRVNVNPPYADDNWSVTRQNPQGGKVRKGTTIALWAVVILRGCVINDRDDMTIEGARITVEEREESTSSDDRGNFILRLDNVPQDFNPRLRVEREGFRPWEGYVSTYQVIRIRLSPSP